MPVAPANLAPYGSFLLASCADAIFDVKAALQSLMEMAMGVVEAVATSERRVGGGDKVEGRFIFIATVGPWMTTGGAHSLAKHVVEERPVGWLNAAAGEVDRLNHLIAMTMSQEGRLLVLATDPQHRAILLEALVAGLFAPWVPVKPQQLIMAFVEGQKLQTLWLAGAHRATSVKPNAKILSGSDLRDAIDPLGDGTFLAGAARSKLAGVSLRNSSVWLRPNLTSRP